MKRSRIILYSIIIGIALTLVTSFIGPRCGLAEPGGVKNGWRGLPIPFYQCGVWGDTYSQADQCVQGKLLICPEKDGYQCKVDKSCSVYMVGIPVLIILIDITFWTGLTYLIMKKYEKKIKK